MRLKTLTVTCIATLALVGGASSASAASKLWLVRANQGSRATVGEAAFDQFSIFPTFAIRCTAQSGGSVLSNGRATDSLAFPTQESSGCDEEASGGPDPAYLVTGNIDKVTLHSDGTALLNAAPKLIVAEPFWCVYTASKLSGRFNTTTQPRTLIIGDVTAALDKKLTLGAGCAATQTMEFHASIFSAGEGDYKLEIVG